MNETLLSLNSTNRICRNMAIQWSSQILCMLHFWFPFAYNRCTLVSRCYMSKIEEENFFMRLNFHLFSWLMPMFCLLFSGKAWIIAKDLFMWKRWLKSLFRAWQAISNPYCIFYSSGILIQDLHAFQTT